MSQLRGLATTALVVLFLAEAQRAFFGSLFGLVYDAAYPSFRPAAAALAALPLVVLAAPLIPLARRLDRDRAVTAAVLAVALARVPMTDPDPALRLLGSALVLAGAGLFLTYAIGHLDRRGVGAGAVLGLLLDQLLRLAGTSYDLSLQPGWLPVQVALSLALVVVAVRGAPAPAAAEPRGFERRAGGLRLRGAVALGALLFLDLHVLGVPPVVARWSAASYPAAGIATAAAGGIALGLTLSTRRPGWGRLASLALAAMLAVASLAGLGAEGAPILALMALGHLAALLLIPRVLDPASGRRGGRNAIVALGLLVGLTAAYALTFHQAVLPAVPGPGPVLGAAALTVAGALLLLPRPGALAPLAGRAPAAAVAVGVAAVGVAAAAALAPFSGRGRVAPPATDSLRVATYNVHYGYDEAWRFDPGRIAEAIGRTDADVIALQAVPVGLPGAYGIDLPRWLGARTGARPRFSAAVNQLLGEAVLARVPLRAPAAVALPDHGGEPARVLRTSVSLDSATVTVLALHPSVRADTRRRQVRDALETAPPGPAIVLGDLNAMDTDSLPGYLGKAGFHDVFRDAGRAGPTFPARTPRRRVDWIWIRGLSATTANVVDATASDHRPVVATVRLQAAGR